MSLRTNIIPGMRAGESESKDNSKINSGMRAGESENKDNSRHEGW